MPMLRLCTRDHSSRLLISISCIASFIIACEDNRPLATEASLASAAGTLAAPSALTAVAGASGRIDLAWQDNSSNESGFEVHGAAGGPGGTFTVWTTTAANARTATFTGLGPGESYCFTVRAFAKKGQRFSSSGSSNTACVTTVGGPVPAVPAAPSGTAATPASLGRVIVTWVDNSDNEEWFRPEHAPSIEGPWQSAGTLLGPGEGSFMHWNVATERQICYRVVAVNANGQSPPSNVDCTAIPAGPSGFTGVNVEGPAIDLAWTDNSLVEDGYAVMRASPGGQWATIVELPPGATRYRDAAVIAGTSYWYEVRAMRDGGFSDAASGVSIVAGGVTSPPAKPILYEVSGYFLGTMWLVWPVDPATTDSTRIERCDKDTCEDADFAVVATVRIVESTMTHRDGGLMEWKAYAYRIRNVNRVGASVPSDQATGRTCIEGWDYMAPCYLPFPGTDGSSAARIPWTALTSR